MTDEIKKTGGQSDEVDASINALPTDTSSGYNADQLEEIAAIQAKRKGKGRREFWTPSMSITSLMDALTILLVFLLMSYATNSLNVNPSADLQLVRSIENKETFHQVVPVQITAAHIIVDNKPIVKVKDGKISADVVRGGEDGFLITPVFDALKAAAEVQKRVAASNSSVKFHGRCMVAADENVNFRLLTQVLYSAKEADFTSFEFAVVRN